MTAQSFQKRKTSADQENVAANAPKPETTGKGLVIKPINKKALKINIPGGNSSAASGSQSPSQRKVAVNESQNRLKHQQKSQSPRQEEEHSTSMNESTIKDRKKGAIAPQPLATIKEIQSISSKNNKESDPGSIKVSKITCNSTRNQN